MLYNVNKSLNQFYSSFTPNTSAVCLCSYSKLVLQCCYGVVYMYKGVSDMVEATQAIAFTLPETKMA